MLTDVRNGTDRALAMAINRVAPRIRTAMSQAVRQQVALRASYVNAALELQRARIGRMRASISTLCPLILAGATKSTTTGAVAR
mgnify:CR=1 FL=1